MFESYPNNFIELRTNGFNSPRLFFIWISLHKELFDFDKLSKCFVSLNKLFFVCIVPDFLYIVNGIIFKFFEYVRP